MNKEHEFPFNHEHPQTEPSLNRFSAEVINSWKRMEQVKLNRFITIDHQMLDALAEENSRNDFIIPSWHYPGVYPQDSKAFVTQQLIGNCFNFAFNLPNIPDGKYAVDTGHDKPLTGSFAMQSKVFEAFRESAVTTDDLASKFFSHDKTIQFFQGINQIPYPSLRFEAAQDFIQGLKQKNQNPLDLLKNVTVYDKKRTPVGLRAFNHRAEKGLVNQLVERFPVAYGADIQQLDSLRFPFAKRAQLVALIIHGRAMDAPDEEARLLPFVDIDKIGPVADYQVPRTLRAMNILLYSDELASKVDNWQEIAKDSHEEIEIRAATVVACNELMNKMNNLRQKSRQDPLNMSHIDYWLWSKSRTYTNTRPHLTETSAY
ncbi:MAG: hypothetical protein HYT11_01035 [Candidatus Levybacteria bacterium]|nr:hypothetical protein [Candidatus Levybacteria bacterium]